MDNKIGQSLSIQSIKEIYERYIQDINSHNSKLIEDGIDDTSKAWHQSELKRLQNDLNFFAKTNGIELLGQQETNITNAVKIKLNGLKGIYVKINNTYNHLNEEEYKEFIELMNADSRSLGDINRYIELSTKNIFGESSILDTHKNNIIDTLTVLGNKDLESLAQKAIKALDISKIETWITRIGLEQELTQESQKLINNMKDIKMKILTEEMEDEDREAIEQRVNNISFLKLFQ